MIFLSILLCICSQTLVAADLKDMFSLEQRTEAKQFIEHCFCRIDHYLAKGIKELAEDAKELDGEITSMIKQEHIDFKRFNDLDELHELVEKEKKKSITYQDSIQRPFDSILEWHEEHEKKAYALRSFMHMTAEWKAYRTDPKNKDVYGLLHKYMADMAETLVTYHQQAGVRSFVAGRHARVEDDDNEVNYDIDRVFFLTMYLLNKELVEAQGS